jgi:hypothetical protein
VGAAVIEGGEGRGVIDLAAQDRQRVAERPDHEVLPRIATTKAGGRRHIETEPLIIDRIAQDEDALPTLISRLLQARLDQRRAYPRPLPLGGHGHRR